MGILKETSPLLLAIVLLLLVLAEFFFREMFYGFDYVPDGTPHCIFTSTPRLTFFQCFHLELGALS